MSATKPLSLLALGTLGAIALFGVEALLVRLGEPQFVPPITLGVALGFIGVIIPVLAWPMRSLTRGTQHKSATPVNPFYATRVLLLAKAGALTGAILCGAGIGIVLFVLWRPVIVPGSLILAGITALGGLILTVGSLLAERWCQIPPEKPGLQNGPVSGGEPA